MSIHYGEVAFGDSVLLYRIVRKAGRKTAEIRVNPDSSLLITVPTGTRASRVAEIVRSRAEWIIKKQWENSRLRRRPPRSFISGESHFYLGRQYQLKVQSSPHPQGRGALEFRNGRFEAQVPENWSRDRKQKTIRALLVKWYRTRAEARLPELVATFANKTGLIPSRVIITETRQRWGSCGRDRTIRLDWRIIMASWALAEYVAAHEVCHLAHRSHSDEFWRRLESIMPDYEVRRDALGRDGGRFAL